MPAGMMMDWLDLLCTLILISCILVPKLLLIKFSNVGEGKCDYELNQLDSFSSFNVLACVST